VKTANVLNSTQNSLDSCAYWFENKY